MTRSVMIVAGGTGGHVYPGLAIAEVLRSRNVELHWMGTRRGVEARIVPQSGMPFFTIPASGLRRRGLLRWLAAPLSIGFAVLCALRTMMRVKPQVVIGMGGFVSAPGGIAAWLCRRPLIIHEQNAVPGLSNRVLSRFARRVLEAFPGSFPASAGALTTGNPVRSAIAALAAPEQRLSGRSGFNILIFGGSRGARALNDIVPAALGACTIPGLRIRHQCGASSVVATRARYAACAALTEVEVEPYIDDMAAAYRWADLVIARAGAITIAEIAACGVGAILIPYPYAVDDHQTRNALYLSACGAAVLLPERELDTQSLCRQVMALAGDREALLAMATRARGLARPQATADVATHCLELIDA